jgi:hypothetical protein
VHDPLLAASEVGPQMNSTERSIITQNPGRNAVDSRLRITSDAAA